MNISTFNEREYKIMTGLNFNTKEEFYNNYINFDKDKFNDVENLRVNSKNVSEFLSNLCERYKNEELLNKLSNCLYKRNLNIYSNGPSFNEFYEKMPIEENIIKLCIKPSVNYFDNYDIFAFDQRVRSGARHNMDYNVNKGHFKVFFGDYYIDNFENYVNNLPDLYNYPKKWCIPNLILSPLEKCEENNLISSDKIDIINTCKNVTIYGYYNIYVPLIIRILELFSYMGIKEFNVTGVDGLSNNMKQKHFFDDFSMLGYDTLLDFYYLNIYQLNKFFIKIYSDDSQMPNVLKYNNKLNKPYLINEVHNIKLDLKKYVFLDEEILYMKLIQYLIDNYIDVAKKKFNNILLCIEYLEKLNLDVNFKNMYFLINLKNLNVLPFEFNLKKYKELNTNLKDNHELISHYVTNNYLKDGGSKKFYISYNN